MEAAGGSASSRRVNPRAELQAKTERNAREAREEEAERQRAVASKAAQEKVDEAARVQAGIVALTQADAAAAAQAEEASRVQPPQLVIPLHAMAPMPDASVVSPEMAGGD